MRRHILTLLLMCILMPCAMAQKHLNVGAVFDGRYRSNPKTTETLLQGRSLRDYKLSVFHGLTLNGMPQEADVIEPLVSKDGTKALEREVSFRNGRLYYAFFQMPSSMDENVYLFYLNQHQAGGNKIVLIYMRGTAQRSDIMKILNN